MSEEQVTMLDIMNQIKSKVHPKGKGRITEEKLIKIAIIAENIELLSKHQITPSNYGDKVKEYFNFINNAFENYGLELSPIFPFKHPTTLAVEIKNILSSCNLNTKQIKAFYELSELVEPSALSVKRHTHKSTIAQILNNMHEEFGKEETNNMLDDAIKEQSHEEESISDEIQEQREAYYEMLDKNRYKFSRILNLNKD